MATDGSGVQMFDGENFTHHSVSDGVTAGETFQFMLMILIIFGLVPLVAEFVILMGKYGIV